MTSFFCRQEFEYLLGAFIGSERSSLAVKVHTVLLSLDGQFQCFLQRIFFAHIASPLAKLIREYSHKNYLFNYKMRDEAVVPATPQAADLLRPQPLSVQRW